MSDRELLEFAAKTLLPEDSHNCPHFMGGFLSNWNPIEDDSDAFRLAIALELDVMCASVKSAEDGITVQIQAGVDKYVATRKAIVEVAAEIGRNME
ncbi:hypothetical protein D3C84_897160 [compost metagenome]